MTMRSCCARAEAKVRTSKGELDGLARKASYAASKGWDTSKLLEDIDRAKTNLEVSKQALIDHEAQHAGEDAA